MAKRPTSYAMLSIAIDLAQINLEADSNNGWLLQDYISIPNTIAPYPVPSLNSLTHNSRPTVQEPSRLSRCINALRNFIDHMWS